MTLKGFVRRLVFVTIVAWYLALVTDEVGWSIYFALLPVIVYEMIRPR